MVHDRSAMIRAVKAGLAKRIGSQSGGRMDMVFSRCPTPRKSCTYRPEITDQRAVFGEWSDRLRYNQGDWAD